MRLSNKLEGGITQTKAWYLVITLKVSQKLQVEKRPPVGEFRESILEVHIHMLKSDVLVKAAPTPCLGRGQALLALQRSGQHAPPTPIQVTAAPT